MYQTSTLTGMTTTGTTTTAIWVPVHYDPPDDDGLAGVREPRRPLPDPSTLHAARSETDG